MTTLKNITNKTSSLLSNNTSGEEDYYEEYETSTINMLLAIVFGALAGFLFISLIKCCIKK
jgi:hypothetical protein